MVFQLNEVKKSYGKKPVLLGASTTLDRGVYGLLGPNGAGKTTLIRIMADILPRSSGSITLDGVDIRSLKESYRDRIGYLPQDVGFYPFFSGKQFLMYMATLKGLSKNAAKTKIEELAAVVGLENELGKGCGKYSGGMRRRLGIAQALLNDPDILILDEPTAGLDPNERIRFRNLISHLSKDRIVLLSTHIVSDIDRIAKTVLMMEGGRVDRQGPSEDFCESVRGLVYTATIDSGELPTVERTCVVANVVPNNDPGKLDIRVIGEDIPVSGARKAEPSLEGAYLHIFQYLPKRSTVEPMAFKKIWR